MLKRGISLALCLLIMLFSFPAALIDRGTVSAEGMSFDDRILYGGTAVDVYSDVCYFEDGALYYLDCQRDESRAILNSDGKYLNFYDDKLWFVSDNKIMSCNPDGSGLYTLKSFDEEISCLYAVDGGVLYMKGEGVFSLSMGGWERELFSREGMAGFVPLSDGSFRWVMPNPKYTPIDEFSGEVWGESEPMYISYEAQAGSSADEDVYMAEGAEAVTYTESTLPDYGGPYVKVGDVTLPLANHMPGTFFSKNGQACTCHNTSSNYCIQSVNNCNCMRYYPTGYKETCEVDLLGAQCFAFARMVFYTCFGFIDHPMNESLYYSVGSLASGQVTANSVKNLLYNKANTGAHIRLAAGHSVSILTMDEDFIVIYHGNAGGNGVVSQPCIVSTRRYTWEQFATAAAAGILYVNMPFNHPNSEELLTSREVGYYKLYKNLNLRAAGNTQSQSLAVIPNGTVVTVTEIDGFWGKVLYNDITGWLFLEYTTFYAPLGITPSNDSFVLGEDGLLRGVVWSQNLNSFSEHFAKQQLTVTSADGKVLSDEDAVGTGCVVSISVEGEIIDKATVCLGGDLNGNAFVDVGDYLMLRRHLLQSYKLSDVQKSAADVNGDSALDTFDYLAIRKYFFDSDVKHFEDFKI